MNQKVDNLDFLVISFFFEKKTNISLYKKQYAAKFVVELKIYKNIQNYKKWYKNTTERFVFTGKFFMKSRIIPQIHIIRTISLGSKLRYHKLGIKDWLDGQH